MIPSYPAIKPQTLIRQLLDQLSNGVQLDRAEHIAGSSYQLQRFTNPEEYDAAPRNQVTAALLSAGGTIPFTGQEAGTEIDHDFTKIFGEQVYGKLHEIEAGFNIEALTSPSNIELKAGDFEGNLASGFRGFAPAAGTHVRITHGGKTYERAVVSVLPAKAASSYGSNNDFDDGLAAAGSTNPATAAAAAFSATTVPAGMSLAVDAADQWSAWDRGSKLNGEYGEKYTLVAVADTAANETTFQVSSLSGQFSGNATFTYAVTTHSSSAAVFGGLTVEITGDASISAGDVYEFEITNVYDVDLDNGTSTDRAIELTGTYTGASDTTYHLTVVEANADGTVDGAKVEIRDSAGIDTTSVATLTDGSAVALGVNGLSATFRDTGFEGLLLGDVFTVKAIAPARTGANKVLVLNGPAADTTGWADTSADLAKVEFFTIFDGLIEAEQVAPTRAYTSTDAGVVFPAGLKVYESRRDVGYKWVPAIADNRSNLFVHYRARRLPVESGEVLEITSPDDITSKLGKVDADNPLAYAAFVGLAGAQGRSIYTSKVRAETVDAYKEAYAQVFYREELFILVPATSDDAIQKAVRDIVNSASAPATRKFKHAYLSVESPGYSPIAERSLTDATNLLATVETGVTGADRVVFQNTDINLADFNIRPGHELRIGYSSDAWGNEIYTTAEIASVLSSTELALKAPLASGTNATAVKVEVHAPPTAEFQADAIAAFAASYGRRRTPVVWSDKPLANTASGEISLPTYTLAAYIGGLRSVMLPQMGLTDRDVGVVSSAAGMYSRFTTEQLDRIAAAGTMLVTQDTPRSTPYIRHQLTTETDKGPLYYEDSIGYNMDEIAFTLNTIPAKYRGQYQASDTLVRQIRFEARNILAARTRAPLDNPLVGPQLADFRDLAVFIHPTLRSKIVMETTLVFFLPFNQMEIRIRGTIDQEESELVELETTL